MGAEPPPRSSDGGAAVSAFLLVPLGSAVRQAEEEEVLGSRQRCTQPLH